VFNLFWRPYVPGFRVRPRDNVPGFNIDENSLLPHASASSDGMLSGAVPQQYPDAVLPEMPYSMSVPTPGSEGLVQSAPSIGLAGFRIRPQDNVLGFNFRPTDDVPGFDPDVIEEQETIWPSQTQPPGAEEPVQPAPPQFPEWVHKLVTMLPQLLAAFDPITGRRVAINAIPGTPSAKPSDATQSASSNAPQQPTDPDIGSRTVASRITTSPPAAAQTGGWPYTQAPRLDSPWSAEITRQPISLAPMIMAKPAVGSNFILANAVGSAGQPGQQQTPLQQYQRTEPSVRFGTGLNAVRLPEKAAPRMAGLENRPEQNFFPRTEAYLPSRVAEGNADNLSPVGPPRAMTQIQQHEVTDQVELGSRDAGGLPNGAIISSDVIGSTDSSYNRSTQRSDGAPSLDLSRDLNIHLVGDEVPLRDLSGRERHQRGVIAAKEMHVARGFEVVVDTERAVDVPGFAEPRYYDYIIRDPITGRHYGVEVKTTLYETIRLSLKQVAKDAVVAAQGAKVRLLDVRLSGVSYVALCFGCVQLDLRSAVLHRILQSAGVRTIRGSLPGDIRP
jgi:hypothetical protein